MITSAKCLNTCSRQSITEAIRALRTKVSVQRDRRSRMRWVSAGDPLAVAAHLAQLAAEIDRLESLITRRGNAKVPVFDSGLTAVRG